jgi:predicted ATPase
VRTLLVHLSKDGLVVLVLEDLHWADASTRELVGFS